MIAALQELSSDLWEEFIGSGGTISRTGNGLLVIRQTDQSHREIAGLLDLYASKSTVPVSPNPKRPLETRFYRVPSETAEDLLTALPSSVAPETWQVAGLTEPLSDPQAVGTIRKIAVGQKIVKLAGPTVKSQSSRNKPTTDEAKKSEEKPATKNAPEVMLVSESVLVIKQTIAVHKQIDDFLGSLGLDYSALGQKTGQGGFGGGGGGFF
ncbi:MAG: hypothetical protein ACKVHE_22295 [Planctomycetales bacterium]